MNLTVEQWKAMPEIKLPWKSEDQKFALTDISAACGTCGASLTDLRGNIYESFGAVELVMGGICQKCKHLVPCRSRWYPKKREFVREIGGKWVTYKMLTFKQKWRREFIKSMLPVIGGMGFAIVTTLLATTPHKWTYVWWGVTLVGLTGLVAWTAWVVARRK